MTLLKENTRILTMNKYSDRFIDFIKKVENEPLMVSGKNAVHASPEGGLDTVGYGHKLTPEEAKASKVYGIPLANITPEKAEQILHMDLVKKEQQLSQTLGRRYDNLPPKNKEMLLDFAFNLGVQGTVEKFPKFTEAVLNNDMETASKEYKRSYTDETGSKKPLARNKQFYDTFLQESPEEPVELDSALMRAMVEGNNF